MGRTVLVVTALLCCVVALETGSCDGSAAAVQRLWHGNVGHGRTVIECGSSAFGCGLFATAAAREGEEVVRAAPHRSFTAAVAAKLLHGSTAAREALETAAQVSERLPGSLAALKIAVGCLLLVERAPPMPPELSTHLKFLSTLLPSVANRLYSSPCIEVMQKAHPSPQDASNGEEENLRSAMELMAFLVAYSVLEEPLHEALGRTVAITELQQWWALANSRAVDCGGVTFLPLGLDAVNHSFAPNAVFVCGQGTSLALFALEDIAVGDQLLVNYAPGAPAAAMHRQYGCLVDLRTTAM